MTLIRYPGAKNKLVADILNALPEELVVPLNVSPSVHYVEPFFGSGAVGIAVMRLMHRRSAVTIADADIGIVSLWRAVKESPRELCQRIKRYSPSVESFYELKSSDGTFTDTVDTGFRKLALHRISVSGFGYMAGGPIGGRSQAGDYTVDCRWRPDKMVARIERLSALFNRFDKLSILHADVFDVLNSANIAATDYERTFVYLDPPYYEKGDQLYKHKFTPQNHEELASVLKASRFDWAISYDDHPEIRRLYEGAEIRRLEITYTNAVCNDPTRRKNHEILIAPAPAIIA